MYRGTETYTFNIDDMIGKLTSNMGKNTIAYPIAYEEKSKFLLDCHVFVP